MPRPPGPVTTQTPSSARRAADQLVGVDALAVDARPALADRRKRGDRGTPRRRRRGRRTAPRRHRTSNGSSYSWVSPIVSPPCSRCTHSSCILCSSGDHVLGFVVPQRVQCRPGEARVVAEAVAVGDRGRQRLVERARSASSAAGPGGWAGRRRSREQGRRARHPGRPAPGHRRGERPRSSSTAVPSTDLASVAGRRCTGRWPPCSRASRAGPAAIRRRRRANSAGPPGIFRAGPGSAPARRRARAG